MREPGWHPPLGVTPRLLDADVAAVDTDVVGCCCCCGCAVARRYRLLLLMRSTVVAVVIWRLSHGNRRLYSLKSVDLRTPSQQRAAK